MSFIENIEKEKEKVALVVFRNNGFSAHHKENGIFGGGCTTGYTKMTPQILKTLKDHDVPLVDASNLDFDDNKVAITAMQMPMVASDTEKKFEFPFSGMTYAPPEIIASIYKAMGADVYNVETVNLTPEMFRSARQRESLAASGFFGGDENKVKEAMAMGNIYGHKMPSGDKLKGTEIANLWNSIVSEYEALAEAYNDAEKERETIPFHERIEEGSDAHKRYKELMTKTINTQSAMSHIEHMVARAGYEASLVISGNQNDQKAVENTKRWCRDKVTKTLASFKEKGYKNKPGEYKHLYDALKEAKRVSDKIQISNDLNSSLN